MKLNEAFVTPASDFRRLSTLGVAVSGFVLLSPFAANNFIQGRPLLGAGSLLIVALLFLNAWGILRGRYYPLLSFLTLCPAILFFLSLSIETQKIIGVLWCYPAVIAFCFMFPERLAWIAIAGLLAVAAAQSGAAVTPAVATRVVASLLAVSVFSVIFVRVITSQQRKLEALATTDSLTGLANRTTLARSLDRATQQSRRTGSELTVITIDIDHFKSVNDTHGHPAGDTILRGVGGLLARRMRRADYTFRMGGEEFLVVLSNTGAVEGRRVADELRKAIESSAFIPDCRVTASMGVATLGADEDWGSLLRRSDENLYRAKAEGRNRVIG